MNGRAEEARAIEDGEEGAMALSDGKWDGQDHGAIGMVL
jgi:hypothetical protein